MSQVSTRPLNRPIEVGWPHIFVLAVYVYVREQETLYDISRKSLCEVVPVLALELGKAGFDTSAISNGNADRVIDETIRACMRANVAIPSRHGDDTYQLEPGICCKSKAAIAEHLSEQQYDVVDELMCQVFAHTRVGTPT